MLTGAFDRRTRSGRSADDGVSLIELVVSMTLMTIVATMTLTFFITMSTATTRTVDANVSTGGARGVLESWSRLLALADSSQATAGAGSGRFQQITPTNATFYADLTNRPASGAVRSAPTKISLSLENGQLVERTYAPLSTTAPSAYPGLPTRTRYLTDKVVLNGWLFTPYVLGTPPTISEPNACSGAAGICAGDPAGDALLPTVIRIDIAFTVQPPSGPAQTFTSSAAVTGGTT
ncbi:MAG: type II secretion system protein J [Jatrophihabitantaceae bacterium]